MAELNAPLARIVNVLTTYSGRDKAIRSVYFALVLASSRLARQYADFAERLLNLARQLNQARLVTRQFNLPQLLQAMWRVPEQLQSAFRGAIAEIRSCSTQDPELYQYQFGTSNGITTSSCASIGAKQNVDISTMGFDHEELRPSVLLGLIDAVWCVMFTRRGSIIATCLIDKFLSSSMTLLYTLNAGIEFTAWIAEAHIVHADALRLFRYSLYSWVGALSIGILRHTLRVLRFGWTAQASAGEWLTLTGLLSDLIAALNILPGITLRPGGKKLTMAQSAAFSLLGSIIGFYKTF